MEQLIIATVIFSLFFSVLSHNTCCLTKEVGGVEYHYVDDYGLDFPHNCSSHCAYYKHGEKGQGKYYCFAKGGHEAKCTESGGSGECGSGSIIQPIAGTSANKDLILPDLNTTIERPSIYGPWSDERLSAFEFNVSLEVDETTSPGGKASLGFTPCYECEDENGYTPYFISINAGTVFGFVDFFVDGIYVFKRGFIFPDCEPRKSQENGKDYQLLIFRVQTFPKKRGLLEFIVDCRNANVVRSKFVNLFNYTTTKPFPYGITYAVFGSKNTSAASYTIRDVDRLPTKFPIADCREGYNTGLTIGTGAGPNNVVTVTPLNIEAPVSIGNVASNQKWCVIDGHDSCKPCGSSLRNHIQTSDKGKIVNINGPNKDGCRYLRAEAKSNGEVTWTKDSHNATKFRFVVAPNTEIHQIRFNNGTCDSPDYVLTWKSHDDFKNGEGKIVAQLGKATDPLKSCFKIYRFLSNVYDRK